MRGIKIILQYHDEHVAAVLKGQEESHRKALEEAIETVNNIIKLNVPLGISIDFGTSYSQIH